MRKKPATKPSAPTAAARVMLLLPAAQASFLDELVVQLSQPGRPATRQDVIRHLLGHLEIEQQQTKGPTEKRRAA